MILTREFFKYTRKADKPLTASRINKEAAERAADIRIMGEKELKEAAIVFAAIAFEEWLTRYYHEGCGKKITARDLIKYVRVDSGSHYVRKDNFDDVVYLLSEKYNGFCEGYSKSERTKDFLNALRDAANREKHRRLEHS